MHVQWLRSEARANKGFAVCNNGGATRGERLRSFSVSVSTFRLCSVMLRIGRFLRAARKLHLSRTRDVAQDSTGYRGYHRVSSVLGGHAAEIAFFGKIYAIFGDIYTRILCHGPKLEGALQALCRTTAQLPHLRDGVAACAVADQEVAVGSQACEAVRRDVYPEDWALWKRHCQG